MYWIFIIISFAITIAAQIHVKSSFRKYSQMRNQRGLTGAEAARQLLLEHGINVTKVYADGIPGGDRAAFESLQKEHPDLMIYPTVHPGMRFARTANVEAGEDEKVLAIGQKAAAFEETDHFVNVVEGGGMTGYEAVTRTCRLMREVFLEKKEMRELVQVKGLGCEVCIR